MRCVSSYTTWHNSSENEDRKSTFHMATTYGLLSAFVCVFMMFWLSVSLATTLLFATSITFFSKPDFSFVYVVTCSAGERERKGPNENGMFNKHTSCVPCIDKVRCTHFKMSIVVFISEWCTEMFQVCRCCFCCFLFCFSVEKGKNMKNGCDVSTENDLWLCHLNCIIKI